MPLLLWPGLAADHRLFSPLIDHAPSITVPPFIEPRWNESLRSYAARYAEQFGPQLPPDGTYAVGGFSFGGQLATELAAVLRPKPRGIVLICGVRGTHQIAAAFRRQQRLGAVIPAAIARRLYVPVARRFARSDRLDALGTERLVAMARDIDPAFLRWSSHACATWPGSPPGLDVPIRHLHGEHDSIIPDVRNEADTVVRSARHLVVLTHAPEVAAFVNSSLTAFQQENQSQN
ncbi:MAG: hypothetical protein AAF937_04740 [Planctomycetota bacterium]